MEQSNVSIIVAMAQNGAIGRGNDLIWHLSADLKFFKATTMGHPIIMGRRTFESIGRALPGRLNVVVSASKPQLPEGVVLAGSLEEAIAIGRNWCAAHSETGSGTTDSDIKAGAAAMITSEGRTENAATASGEVFITGGGRIYAQAMDIADRIYLTRVYCSPDDADTFFPAIDENKWALANAGEIATDEKSGLQYRFETWERKGNVKPMETTGTLDRSIRTVTERM